jgi:hypothetical protein
MYVKKTKDVKKPKTKQREVKGNSRDEVEGYLDQRPA